MIYKYLIVVIIYLSSITIFVKSQTLPIIPDSCFCLNYYENSEQCDSSVSQLCYACGECYNDVNQLELYSLIKPCDSDNVEIHIDSTCTSYAGILKDTCFTLNDGISFSLTSGNCLDLIFIDTEFSLATDCPIGGICVGNLNITCGSSRRCSGFCQIRQPPIGNTCVGGASTGSLCSNSSDCIVECLCNEESQSQSQSPSQLPIPTTSETTIPIDENNDTTIIIIIVSISVILCITIIVAIYFTNRKSEFSMI